MDELSIREIFPKKLLYFMKLNGKMRNDLVRDLGFKYSTIRDWEKGLTVPRMDKVEMLANYFGCTPSDLLQEKEKPTGENTDEPFANLSEEARKFLVVFEKLTPDQKEQLYRLALTIVGEVPQPL